MSLTPTANGLPNQAITPMLRQYLDIKAGCNDALLFFRMGDFYELFFEDAKLAAPILGIALTSRDRKSDNPVPMCGVPHHSAESYIAKLVEQGYRVAICEQMEDPTQAKGIVRREIVRIVTPGSISLERPTASSHYIGAARANEGGVGLAYADLATGEFFGVAFDSLPAFLDGVASLQLKELLVAESEAQLLAPAQPGAAGAERLSWRSEGDGNFNDGPSILRAHLQTRSLLGFGLNEKNVDDLAIAHAAGALLRYLQQTQRCALTHLRDFKRLHSGDALMMDASTRRNLELTESNDRQLESATLFSVLRRTLTPMGERQLRHWIERPLLDIAAIQKRQAAVHALFSDATRLQEVRQWLRPIRDLDRLRTKLLMGRLQGRDLVTLMHALAPLPQLGALARECIEGCPDLIALSKLHAYLHSAIDDEACLRSTFDPELAKLRQLEQDSKGWLAQLEEQERQRTGINNLKVRFNQVFGYYIEITSSHLHRVPSDYQRRQTLVNAERFITPQLKTYEEQILTAGQRLASLEASLLQQVSQNLLAQEALLQAAARWLADLDTVQSLALVALERGYCRPTLHDDKRLEIRQGRHPIVEAQLRDQRFVPNDVMMDVERRQILLITGPNMAGKSTILRQVALIVLMAQIGSFVPAQSAAIGIVDRLAARLGANDDIAKGRSTFMVEMEETAQILRQATSRSLLILDEIGRGTSTYDGLSIAWAVLEYLHDCLGARTLFATHYHELIARETELERLVNMHVAIQEVHGKIIFLHELRGGGVSRSYGIAVARLAGLPDSITERAKMLLHQLEGAPAPKAQLPLFAQTPSPLQEALAAVDVDGLTPIEALNLLARWKRENL